MSAKSTLDGRTDQQTSRERFRVEEGAAFDVFVRTVLHELRDDSAEMDERRARHLIALLFAESFDEPLEQRAVELELDRACGAFATTDNVAEIVDKVERRGFEVVA
jgi:hypothetical protein